MKNMISPPDPGPDKQTSATPPGLQTKSFNIVDLKQYFHIIVKRIWLVALCFVISLAVMVVMLFREVPTYRATASLLFSRGLDLPIRQREVHPATGDRMQTELRIIQGSKIRQRANEIVRAAGSEISGQLIGINVGTMWQTSIMVIHVNAYDPHFAADYANALAEAYLEFKSEQRIHTSQSTVLSLTQQANRIREELERAENQVKAFERDNRVIAIHERGNIAAHNLASLSAQAAGFRTQRLLLEAQQPLLTEASDEVILATLAGPLTPMYGAARTSLAGLGGRERPAASPESPAVERGPEALLEMGIIDDQGWANLQRSKARHESELTEMRTRFRDAHPLVQAKLRTIADLDRALDVELQFALKKYYTDLEALDIRYRAARRAEHAWEEEALDVTRRMQEYESLQRNVNRLRALYDLVFARLKEIDIAVGIEPEDVQIWEPARPPGAPVAPRKVQSIFLAALIGLGIGLGLVFGLEFIDDSVRYPEEVTKGLGLPFFGVIPAANWDPDDLRSHMLSNLDQKSGLVEAYRNVRSSLLFSGSEEDTKSLVVTSAVPREGKTTTCLNISVSLAQAGSRVLLVDGDLRRGELHKFFGVEGGRGLADILVGQAKPESVIQRTGIPNLDLVATGPFPPNPAELMLRPELHAFLDYAKRSYDRILFDCPPIMAVSEAGIMASQVDGVLFVVWAGQTSRKLSQLSVQVLRERGANILGCILNNLEFGRVGYYYYSTYYGYYDYDYRYERSTAPSERKSERL